MFVFAKDTIHMKTKMLSSVFVIIEENKNHIQDVNRRLKCVENLH